MRWGLYFDGDGDIGVWVHTLELGKAPYFIPHCSSLVLQGGISSTSACWNASCSADGSMLYFNVLGSLLPCPAGDDTQAEGRVKC